jgi:hypothetical protein
MIFFSTQLSPQEYSSPARAHSIPCRSFTEIETIYRPHQDLLCKVALGFVILNKTLLSANDPGEPREAPWFSRRNRAFGLLPRIISSAPSAHSQAPPAW